MEKVKQNISAWSLKLNYWSPRHQTAVQRLSNALSFSQLVEIYNKFTQFERKLRKFTGRLNSKISVTCTSCGNCQQLRLIFSLRTHRISIRLHMEDHKIPLCLFIISVYILTILVL